MEIIRFDNEFAHIEIEIADDNEVCGGCAKVIQLCFCPGHEGAVGARI